jgi:hypothetical protein
LLRATVLDRLVDNKMYYKFIEFGNIEKEKEQIRKEEAEEEKRIDEELAREREEHLRNNPFLGNHMTSGDLRPNNSEAVQNNDNFLTFNEDEEDKGLFESEEEDDELPSKKKASSPSPKKFLRIADDSDEETSPMKFSNFNSPAKSPSINTGLNKMSMTMYGTTKHLEETKKNY